MKIKYFIIGALMFFVGLTGCSMVTDLVYGPDMTPMELKESIYRDAFDIGAMWAVKKDVNKEELILDAEKILSVDDPRSAINTLWLESIKRGDTEHALIYFAARRLYDKVGASLIDDKLNIEGLNLDLLKFAVEAYIEGIKQTM